MRIAALGFPHESNTFIRGRTGRARLEELGILRGPAIEAAHSTARTAMAGYLAVRSDDISVRPLIYVSGDAGARLDRTTFDDFVGEMLELLEREGPWDAILLAQHGAAVADGIPDADATVTARIRALVGPSVPIGVTLDMHANVSKTLVELTDITVVGRTNPHIDEKERGTECARLIVRTARREILPVQAIEKPPVAINILRHNTSEAPMAAVIAELDHVLQQPGILSGSIALGYPYADVDQMGMTAIAIHDGDAGRAMAAARNLGAAIWSHRADFYATGATVAEAMDAVRRSSSGPVLLLDVGDNVGGGGPGDSTVLLEAAIDARVEGVVFVIHDPEAAAACVAGGVGADLELVIGAKTDAMHGRPVLVRGHVRNLTDGRFEDPAATHGGNRYFDTGVGAVLETTAGHTILLTAKRTYPASIEQLRSAGISPERYKAIVAKGVQSPRPSYEPVASQTIFVDTPGVTVADFLRLPYSNRRNPMFPFEPNADY